MSWVAKDCAERSRNSLGTFFAHQWSDCATRLGLRVVRLRAEMPVPACSWDKTIFISADVPMDQMASVVWLEIGHRIMHRGSDDWWLSRPQGAVMVGKRERQAETFAREYPVWE